MSELRQSGVHPDADQLTAFAEQMLPQHEREETLAHLAACADCRRIVFLAQGAEPVEVAPAVAAGPRRPWYAGWNLAWPVAALGAMMVVTVHNRHAAPVKPQVTMASVEALPAPVPAAAPVVTPPMVKPEKPAQLESRMAGRDTVSLGAVAPAKGAPPAFPPPLITGAAMGQMQQAQVQQAQAQRAQAPQPPRLNGPSQQMQQGQVMRYGSLDQARPMPAAPAMGVAQATVATAAAAGAVAPRIRPADTASAMQADAAAAPAAPAPVTLAPAAPPPPAAAPRRSSAGNDAGATDGVGKGNLVAPVVLPSHLAMRSSVARGGVTVSIDSAGAVFLSKDSGRHWKEVGGKWAGRPVQVGLVAKPDFPGAEDKQSKTSAKPAVFELTTDTGVVWVSGDGKDWKRR